MRLTLISISSAQNHAESQANSHVYAVVYATTVKHCNYYPLRRSESLVQNKHHDTEDRMFLECNLLSIPWMSEISGAIHLEQPGLTAGRQADEI